jgi:hypothetical protein
LLKNTKPSNDFDALKLALTLAITGTDEKKIAECVDLAESISLKMPELDVERAKKQAANEAKEWLLNQDD